MEQKTYLLTSLTLTYTNNHNVINIPSRDNVHLLIVPEVCKVNHDSKHVLSRVH